MIKRFETFQRVLFTMPVILLCAVFLVYPIIQSFHVSLTDYNGMNRMNFIGFSNYIELFKSDEFFEVLLNNAYFLLLGVPLSVFLPLVISILLYEGVLGHRFFKVAFLLPTVLSVSIVGLLFRFIFAYEGPFNKILTLTGLDRFAVDWIASGRTSIPLIITAMIWSSFGVNVIIYLAGMATVPTSVYESADLDGFSWFGKLFFITLPMIWNVFEFVTITSIISVCSSMFGYIFNITNGGPGYESTVLEYLLYIKGFRLNDLGYASAIAMVLLVAIVSITGGIRKLFAKGGM